MFGKTFLRLKFVQEINGFSKSLFMTHNFIGNITPCFRKNTISSQKLQDTWFSIHHHMRNQSKTKVKNTKVLSKGEEK